MNENIFMPDAAMSPSAYLPGALVPHAANLLSSSRFVLAAIWLAAFVCGRRSPGTLIAIALAGVASDILDGRVARWVQSVGNVGKWLDNVADLVFVLTALCCEAASGFIPFYIPALIAFSFTQYAVDSVLIRGSAVPVKSRLGHWGGIVNYSLVILLAWAPPPFWPGVLLRTLSPIIAAFYVAAILERSLSYWRIRPVVATQQAEPRGNN